MRMLQARALTPTIGAEISGVDLTQALSEEAMDWIRHQLLHYKVIFFRDQSIDTQQHIAFAKQFGELEKHPIQPKEGFPEVMVLHNDAERPPAGTAFWHSDVTWRPEPSLGSILNIMIGIKNPLSEDRASKSACLWFNELRLTDFDKTKGWAANASLNVKLSDIMSVEYFSIPSLSCHFLV